VKRALITIAALLVCGAIGSTARAQTPAQTAKFNRYLSRHPGVAQQLAANQGMTNVPSYLASYPGAQNYSSAYQTQYMKNLATYNYYLSTHPGLAANQGMGNVGSYMASYPGQYSYPPTQQLASNPIMALVAPFMSSNPGLQNYGGGYGGVPAYQSPYAATSYASPYGSGAYGSYGSGAYGPSAGAPMSQPWHHRHFGSNSGPAAQFNGQFLGTTSSASHASWAASHPFASAGRHSWWGRNH